MTLSVWDILVLIIIMALFFAFFSYVFAIFLREHLHSGKNYYTRIKDIQENIFSIKEAVIKKFEDFEEALKNKFKSREK